MNDVKKMNEELACKELIALLSELSESQKVYLQGVADGMIAEHKCGKD